MAVEADLIERILDYLGGPGSGQTPNADDVTKVEKYIAAGIDDINLRLGVYISSSDDIPDGQLIWLATAIAHLPPLARFYGIAPDPAIKQYAETMLSAQVDNSASGTVKFVDY